MESKNFILAIVLSLSFLVLWNAFVVPKFAPPPRPATGAVLPTEATPPSSDSASAVPTKGSAEIQNDIPFQNVQNELLLASRGGGLKHWLISFKNEKVDLVNTPDTLPRPLSSFSDNAFQITSQGNQAVMTAALPNGLQLTKTLRLNDSDFLHDVTYRFRNPTGRAIDVKDWDWGWGPGLGTAENEHKENARLTRVLTPGKEKVHVMHENDQPAPGLWVAIDNRYFLVAFIPDPLAHPKPFVSGSKDQTALHLVENTSVPAHGETTVHYRLYVGPKGYTHLKTYGIGLEQSVDFGTFSAIGKMILNALYHLKNWTGNYGWSIVLLTMALQVLLIPLSLKSFRAQLSMKKLQPQIAALQAQYKNDPKRLNVEMMNIYKKTGTNPFGGCLPMLLQLPIFWALFTTLRNAYELRGAPWIGWVHDLSVPDTLPFSVMGFHLHLLPVIMGAGMFLQQRLSGAITDPTQKQMMVMMPIMFTVMFFNFPAGLVLYWLTNSIMTMSFQYIFQKTHNAPTNIIDTTIVKP